MTTTNFWSRRAKWRIAGLACLAVFSISIDTGRAQTTRDLARDHHQRGVEHHLRRSLDDASREYTRALALDPPRELSADEWMLVRRFAPRLYTTPTEFFPLKDFAVVLDPSTRQIAYHMFWEDDIDFPEDNDPCDHELVWVQYSSDGRSVEKLWAYFHGRILAGGSAALADARANNERFRVNVQWGKHGSMPIGWEYLSIVANDDDAEKRFYPIHRQITVKQYQEGTYRKLAGEGRRLASHPLGVRLGWPARFTGSWNDFVNYSRLLDPLTLLDQRKMARVSNWNSGTINQHFLTYNFRPKTEWPPATDAPQAPRAASPLPRAIGSASLTDFKLPPKSVFDRAMPRYPNVWFYIDTKLATSYQQAVKLVTENLRTGMRLMESYGPFSNPEGCDFEVLLEHLQPWEVREHRALQHSHAFHMRYYHSALERQNLARIRLARPEGEREFYRFGASAHYEVEHTNPNHADVEICPLCGRTGEYADLKGNLVELVHDPLGLELVMTGKIRGKALRFEDWERREVGSIAVLKEKFRLEEFIFPAQADDKNTLRIGVVVISSK